jgi:hypothetical protein
MFRRAKIDVQLTAVSVTGGLQTTHAKDGFHTPKKDLVGALEVLMNTGRFEVAPNLKHAGTLMRELEHFRIKKTAAGNDTFAAWRERDHDDLCFAVGLIAWFGEKMMRTMTPLRTYRFGTPSPKQRKERVFLICSKDEVEDLDLDGNNVQHVHIADPGCDEPAPVLNIAPPNKLLGAVTLRFLDVIPEEFGHDWAKVVEPYGLTYRDLMVTRNEHGRELWKLLLKHAMNGGGGVRAQPDVVIITDNGGEDRRAASVAAGICDALQLDRARYVGKASDADWKLPEKWSNIGLNEYVIDAVKGSRSMVCM